MSEHESYRLRLHAYIDNELDADGALEVEAHLAQCEACRKEFEETRALKSALAGARFVEDMPQGLALDVRRAVRKARPRPWYAMPAAMSGMAAAAAAILVIVALPRPSPLTDELVSSHVRSMMGSHLVDVASSDHHTVKPWFDGKIAFAPPVLAQAGDCVLIGGRLDDIARKPTAAMAYRCGAHVVNFYAQPDDRRSEMASATAPKLTTARGYHVVSWKRGALDCYAVSDMAEPKLLAFARFIEDHAQEG